MKSIIFFPIVLILVIYMVIGQIIPTYKEARTQQKENAQQMAEVAKQEEKLAAIARFVDSVAQHEEERAFLDEFVPADTTEQQLINSLPQYSDNRGVYLADLNVAGAEGGVQGSAIGLSTGSFTVMGDYDQLLAFMQNLFRMGRLYTFDNASITKLGELERRVPPEFLLGPDSLVLQADFHYANVEKQPTVTVKEFDRVLSFESIAAIKAATEKTNPIVLESVARNNPFVP